MIAGIVVLILGLALIIVDGLSSPPWRLCRAIGRGLNTRVIRRFLRFLFGITFTAGALFLGSTIGFLVKNDFLVVIPAVVAMGVLSVALIGGKILERMAHEFFRLLGFKPSDPTLVRELEKSFLGIAFWVYMLLSLYPMWNPWTGNPKIVLFLIPFGLGLFAYSRWAATGGKRSKILAIIIIPLLFFWLLGKQEVDRVEREKNKEELSTLGSVVRWGSSKLGLKNAERNLDSAENQFQIAVYGQRIDFTNDATTRTKNIKEATLKPGFVPLTEKVEKISLEEFKKSKFQKVRVEQFLPAAELPEELKLHFDGVTEFFYKIRFPDEHDKFSKDSKVGYIETNGVNPFELRGGADNPASPRMPDKVRVFINKQKKYRWINTHADHTRDTISQDGFLAQAAGGGPLWFFREDETFFVGFYPRFIQMGIRIKLTPETGGYGVGCTFDQTGNLREGPFLFGELNGSLQPPHQFTQAGWLMALVPEPPDRQPIWIRVEEILEGGNK